MGILSFFGSFFKQYSGKTLYIGTSGARSKPWNLEVSEQEICRAIIDCNACHTAKAQVLHVRMDKQGRVEKIERASPYTKLFERPNPMMTGYDLLYALSWQADEKNTALGWIRWGVNGKPEEIWPVAYSQFEFVKIAEGGYAVHFFDLDGGEHVLPQDDMVILRRHYDGSGVAGASNAPVYEAIQMAHEVDDSIKSAVTISNKIHGILSKKKAMINKADVRKGQEEFSQRMLAASKTGGILELDGMEEYTQLNPTAWAANAAQMKQIYDRIYAYWRTPMEVVLNTATEQTMQNFYDSVIEPRWQAMGQALTQALFSRHEQDRGDRIMLYGGAATGASWATKLAVITDTKEMGLLTVNEYRGLLGWAPVEDGDQRLVSLNYVNSKDMSRYQMGGEPPDPKPAQEPKNEGSETNAV